MRTNISFFSLKPEYRSQDARMHNLTRHRVEASDLWILFKQNTHTDTLIRIIHSRMCSRHHHHRNQHRSSSKNNRALATNGGIRLTFEDAQTWRHDNREDVYVVSR